MGLALHDPVSSLPDLTELRHLPPGRSFTKANKSKISAGRYLTWVSRYKYQLPEAGYWASSSSPPKLRPHQIAILNSIRRPAERGYHESKSIARFGVRTRRSWVNDDEEGQDLARSRIRLPSDGSRSRRPPSLERQEAFRDANTAKKRQQSFDETDEAEDAELYRRGLLYHDEHERGSGFNLNNIVHDQPVYSLNVRANKRGRTQRVAKQCEVHETLPLDLSFAALTDDDAVARYLISPTGEEFATEAAELPSQEEAGARQPPVTIIYELDEGSTHSLHGIIATDFPDLISDSDDDDSSEDWAILRRGSGEDNDGEDAASIGPDAWIVLG